MHSFEAVIRSAIEGGRPLSIVYNGGSTPGRRRAVMPLEIQGDSLVARDTESNTRKTFKLNLVASVTESEGEIFSNPLSLPPKVSSVPDLPTLAAYAELWSERFREKGWHVTFDAESFALYTYFKNGKPKKTPSVRIAYFDRSNDSDFDFAFDLGFAEFVEQKKEPTGRERPWRLDSWRLSQGKSYASLHKAMEMFFEEAATSDPATSGTVR